MKSILMLILLLCTVTAFAKESRKISSESFSYVIFYKVTGVFFEQGQYFVTGKSSNSIKSNNGTDIKVGGQMFAVSKDCALIALAAGTKGSKRSDKPVFEIQQNETLVANDSPRGPVVAVADSARCFSQFE